MKEIRDKQAYETVISQDKPVLLDFYADWCPPCQALMPSIERLADKYADDFVITKVNVDQNPELSRLFNVKSIPALFVLNDREIKERLQGFQTEKSLDNLIQKYLPEA